MINKKTTISILSAMIISLGVLMTGCQSSGQSDQSEEATGEVTVEEEAIEEDYVSGALAAPSVNGALQVDGTHLTDQSGNDVQLRGISTHGLSWYPEYINSDCLADLHAWGANVIRLAMYTDESGGYCTDGDQKELKDLIKKAVDLAEEENMYAVVDWHILSDGNPLTYQDEAESFFKEMSAEFADKDNVLYEICNEPNGDTDWNDIKTYAEAIIPVIRDNDEDAVIIVGTPNWSQEVDKAAADPIEKYDNIMYSLHFYAATHKDDLRDTMTSAVESGLPIFVTEFGICDASGSGDIDKDSADKWIDLLDKYEISYIAWNLSNKDETSAMIKSSVDKTYGFTKSDFSASGKWVYDMLMDH